MLVYTNHLSVVGAGAEDSVFRAVGAWLREQLGFGLHPDQMRRDGEFEGSKDGLRSRLRVLAATGEEPVLYSWSLRHQDSQVRARAWTTELGVKEVRGTLEVSCVVTADDDSTMVTASVTASQPRVIRYVVNNVREAADAEFAAFVPGEHLRSVGADRDSYAALLLEVERRDREGPIVLLSPTREGHYLINPDGLQRTLVGLAQVVAIEPGFNSWQMSEVLGRDRSAWNGAINILFTPHQTGFVRNRLFLEEEVLGWGDTDALRIPRVLGWVTTNTNIARLRRHIRPDGVMLLASRRRARALQQQIAGLNVEQLRSELDEAAKREAQREKFFTEIVDQNDKLEQDNSRLMTEYEALEEESRQKDFALRTLKAQLSRAGDAPKDTAVDAVQLVRLLCRDTPPSPLECIEMIENVFADRCVVLDTAREAAGRVDHFIYGRTLLDLLRRLVTEYRDALMAGGDTQARKVFGKNEYAAWESDTVVNNRSMRRQRTFPYKGEDVEMFSHLKIGAGGEDTSRVLRVHFHWDSERELIAIGYCGEHLAISSQ